MGLDPFLQKVILLLLTALITGFGIPFVLKRIEERKVRKQKKFEAELARQGEIIKAQSKFLEDIIVVLWKWRYLAKQVTYYGSLNIAERYNIARKEYDEKTWDLINQFRAGVCRSRRLVSEKAYEELKEFYDYVVHDIDQEISDLTEKEGLDPETVEGLDQLCTRFSEEVSQRIDDAIDALAEEVQLKAGK